MKVVPSYTKILALGSAYTENALVGDVVVQEKIDGSQFGFGLNEDGELAMRSKGQSLDEFHHDKMFAKAVNYILSIKDKIKEFPKDTYFYGEYLQSPKHNVLKYTDVPKNNIVLFDVLSCGKWVDRNAIEEFARQLDIDIIPEFYRGKATVEKVKELLTEQSYLGGEIVEGVVIKNYAQTILLGGQVFPLFTKYVREAFKERHAIEWGGIHSKKGNIEEFISGFANEARWQKALIHLKEKGLWTNSPKDIGPLIKMIQDDVMEEETQNIKDYLFKLYEANIKRKSVSHFPEWYKNKLLENLNE